MTVGRSVGREEASESNSLRFSETLEFSERVHVREAFSGTPAHVLQRTTAIVLTQEYE